MINVYGLPIGHTKWVKLFTWSRSIEAGLDRASAEAAKFGYKFAAFTAMTKEQASNISVYSDEELEELGGLDAIAI